MVNPTNSNPFRRSFLRQALDGIRRCVGRWWLWLDDGWEQAVYQLRTLAVFRAVGNWLRESAIRVGDVWHKFVWGVKDARRIRQAKRLSRNAQLRWLTFWDESRLRLSRSVVAAPARKLVRMRQDLVIYWEGIQARLLASPRLKYLSWPLRTVGRIVLCLADFVAAWLWTRPYRALWLAAPACLLLALVGFVAARASLRSDFERGQRYRLAAYQALRENDRVRVDLCYRKLAQLGQETPSDVYDKAIRLDREGDYESAYQLMQQLAPLDAEGFGEAHLWIANAVVQNRIQISADEQARILEYHLTLARQQMPTDPQAAQLLAVLYRVSNRPEQAMAILREFPDRDLSPADSTVLAQLFLRWGDTESARRVAQRADRAFQDAESEEALVALDYVSWSTALEIDHRYTASLDLLFDASERLGDAVLQERARQASLHFLTHLGRGDLRRFDDWLQVAEYLLSRTDTSADIQVLIVTKLQDPLVSNRIDSALQPYAKEGRLAPLAHSALADWLLSQSHYERAEVEYRRVLKKDRQHAKAANNLAWLYSTRDPKDLGQALRFANHAVQCDPNNPGIRETRGQILKELERWHEALADLQAAVNGLPQQASIHAALADCYAALGDEKLANAHRALDR